MANTIQEKDIVYIDYEVWIKEAHRLHDTTSKELAEKEEIYDENRKYEPLPLVVEDGRDVKILIDLLTGGEVGKEYDFEVPPGDAFGVRDPEQIKLHSMREVLRAPEFEKNKESMGPYVGMDITIGDKKGIITTVTAGRVRVDYNHPLAGRTLSYKLKVDRLAKTQDEKASAIIDMHYGLSTDFGLKFQGKNVMITLPDPCKYDQRWHMFKIRIITDLRDLLGLETITFLEEYVKKERKDENDGDKDDSKDGSKDKKAKDELKDKNGKDESKDKKAKDESKDKKAKDEPKDKKAKDESKDKKAKDESKDKKAKDESKDKKAKDESKDKKAKDGKSSTTKKDATKSKGKAKKDKPAPKKDVPSPEEYASEE